LGLLASFLLSAIGFYLCGQKKAEAHNKTEERAIYSKAKYLEFENRDGIGLTQYFIKECFTTLK
jgi:hypothetical protein